MEFLRTSFNGDPNVGLYGFATDTYCFIGANADPKAIKETLKVPVHHIPLLNIDFSGIFVTGNSRGIVIPKAVRDYDMPRLKAVFGKDILVLKTDYSALGNLILMNDKGIVISPIIKKHRGELKQFFGVPCEISTIAKQKMTGSLALATNKGCLLHPRVRKEEMKLIEETLSVKSEIGTVNFGSPYPGSGIIANSHGCVVGENSSGPELGRIAEALGFV